MLLNILSGVCVSADDTRENAARSSLPSDVYISWYCTRIVISAFLFKYKDTRMLVSVTQMEIELAQIDRISRRAIHSWPISTSSIHRRRLMELATHGTCLFSGCWLIRFNPWIEMQMRTQAEKRRTEGQSLSRTSIVNEDDRDGQRQEGTLTCWDRVF